MTGHPEPTRLVDVPEYLCRIRPGRAAPAREWAEFYQRSSDVYARVAQTDRTQRHAAMAISAIDHDKAAKYREAISNTPQ